jgi:hypothetical protein
MPRSLTTVAGVMAFSLRLRGFASALCPEPAQRGKTGSQPGRGPGQVVWKPGRTISWWKNRNGIGTGGRRARPEVRSTR